MSICLFIINLVSVSAKTLYNIYISLASLLAVKMFAFKFPLGWRYYTLQAGGSVKCTTYLHPVHRMRASWWCSSPPDVARHPLTQGPVDGCCRETNE